MSPTVTVLLTTYNHEAYVARAIDGVIMQETSFPVHLVINEDCSSDATATILKQYQAQYPQKIRLNLAPRNRNDNTTFMAEIAQMQSPYYALLDGDDYWTSTDKLQRQVAFLDAHPQCTLCFHNVEMQYDDDSRAPHLFHETTPPTFSSIDDLWLRNFIPGCSPLLRHNAVPSLPDWFVDVALADWALYLLYADHGPIGYIDECMGVYRIHSGGAWAGVVEAQRYEAVLPFYQQMDHHFQGRYHNAVQAGLARHYFVLARAYQEAGQPHRAFGYALRCLRAYPHHRPAIRRGTFRRIDLFKLILALLPQSLNKRRSTVPTSAGEVR